MPLFKTFTRGADRATEALNQPRRAAAAFIYITIVLDMMALGVTIPVLPRLIQTLGGGDAGGVARTFGLFAAVFALMQFLAQPVQGALSDRFGRRPIILASNFGLGLDYLLMALAPSLGWLFVGRVIAGGAAGSMTAASAYMADVSPADQRAGAFGQLFGAASIGIVLGPMLGGLLAGLDPRAPFWAAAGLSLANAVYGAFVLPESLKPGDRAPVVLSQLNPVGSLLHLTRSYPIMLGVMTVVLLSGLSWQGVYALFVVYTAYRYGWTPADIGILLAVLGAFNFVVTTWLITRIVARIGERWTALIGLGLQVVALGVFGLARTGLEFWVAVPFMCLGNIGGPAWQALVSNRVGANEQGRLAGAFNGMFAIAGMVAPLAFTAVFAATVGDHGRGAMLGAPFYAAAALTALAVGLAAWVTRTPYRVGAESSEMGGAAVSAPPPPAPFH